MQTAARLEGFSLHADVAVPARRGSVGDAIVPKAASDAARADAEASVSRRWPRARLLQRVCG